MGARESRLAIGLMGGTSMDGIDAALIRTDGAAVFEPVVHLAQSYDPAFRAALRSAVGKAGAHKEIAAALTVRHAEAVRALLAESHFPAANVEIVGFHGHTVLHDPVNALTVQIGDGQRLANEVGIDVVADFRTADVQGGGQGAPLAPIFHVVRAPEERPVCFLNIGGVANLTWIGAKADPARTDVFEHLLAFDTGPGGALIDDWVYRHTGEAFDQDGRFAAAGQVDLEVLARLMSDKYFRKTPPKSLDRDAFDVSPVEGLSPEGGAATLTAFTVAAVAQAAMFLPVRPARWLVTGGGRKNTTLMRGLRHALNADVAPTEAAGIDGDILEAQAFAYLAVRSLRGLPLSGPKTTGVVAPTPGGRLFRPA
ncbi:MAG: anhydro-N-acetylmuramic acid kinase [Rhodospirillaceae bacterium]|nr:anhydro-N-acetylmuramic acid kinase [Rhodospirillaceae bacterium]